MGASFLYCLCYNADRINELARRGKFVFGRICGVGSVLLAAAGQFGRGNSDGGRQEESQTRCLAHPGKDLLCNSTAGRQYRMLGRYVPVPPQNQTLVFCSGNAGDSGGPTFTCLVAENTHLVKSVQNKRAFLALPKAVCYTE